MAGFPNLFASLGKWINAINMESEEQKQRAVNVQWIGIVGAALFMLVGLLFAFALGEAITAAAMWVIAIVIALGLWMIRRKYISLASMMALVSISSLLTYAIVQGNGSYSIGFALYPALVVFSSLLLSRKLQVVYVGIVIASITPTRHWMPILAIGALVAAYSIIVRQLNIAPTPAEIGLVFFNLLLLLWAAAQNALTVRAGMQQARRLRQATRPVAPPDEPAKPARPGKLSKGGKT